MLLSRRASAHTTLVLAALALATLAIHPVSRFYPPCLIHQYFGILCPGCGATRALAALLRGHFAEAWHTNQLFVCALPLLAIYAVANYRKAVEDSGFNWPRVAPAFAYASLAGALLFTIVRNVPINFTSNPFATDPATSPPAQKRNKP